MTSKYDGRLNPIEQVKLMGVIARLTSTPPIEMACAAQTFASVVLNHTPREIARMLSGEGLGMENPVPTDEEWASEIEPMLREALGESHA